MLFFLLFCGVSVAAAIYRGHTSYSGQYLKNGMMDQIRHVDVTGPQGVPYFKVTLNSQ